MIVAQIGVDLTHIDLITLDAFHRIIGKKLRKELRLQGNNGSTEKMLKELDEELYRWAFESSNEPEISRNILQNIGRDIYEE